MQLHINRQDKYKDLNKHLTSLKLGKLVTSSAALTPMLLNATTATLQASPASPYMPLTKVERNKALKQISKIAAPLCKEYSLYVFIIPSFRSI